jgi:hypothetical protein
MSRRRRFDSNTTIDILQSSGLALKNALQDFSVGLSAPPLFELGTSVPKLEDTLVAEVTDKWDC